MHTCPRCESNQATVVAKWPVEGAWEVYLCPVCNFTWRSSEPETITNPDKYRKAFKVNLADIPFAAHVPAIPDRIASNK